MADDSVTVLLPLVNSIKKNIIRYRAKEETSINIGRDDIPIELQLNHRFEGFLKHDSGPNDPKRIIIFCSDFKENFVCNSNLWLVDGTFKVVPHGFAQLVTIHTLIIGKAFPLIYILLQDKTYESYIRAFEIVKSSYNPKLQYVITDFETALHDAVKCCFLFVSAEYCWFHFTQAI